MRNMNFVKVLAVLVLCVIGVGFYRGWFVVSSHPSGAAGTNVDVNLTVDKEKMKSDVKSIEAKAQDLVGPKSKSESESGSTKDDEQPKGN